MSTEKKKVIIQVEVEGSDKAEKSLENINDLKNDSTKVNQKVSESQDKLSKSTSATNKATGGLLTSFKALLANPVGIALAAIAGIFITLKKAIGRSSAASETFSKIGAKLSAVFNGFLAILEPVVEFVGEKLLNALNDPKQAIKELGDSIKENLINRIQGFLKIGEAFSLLLKGEFKKAGDLATEALLQTATGIENLSDKVKIFAEEAKENYDKAAKATENLANAERRLSANRIALEKQQLTSLRLAEEQRQIRDDASLDIEQRIAANEKLGKILDDQAKNELSLAQQQLNLARLQAQASGDTIENLEAVGDAEIKLLEIQERITGQRSEQLVNVNTLLKEQRDLKVAEQKAEEERRLLAEEKAKEEKQREFELQLEYDELEIERLQEKGEKTLDLELALLEKKREQDVSQEGLRQGEIDLINDEYLLKKQRLNRAVEEAEKAKEEAVLENAINGAAEAFGIQQEVALARMIMSAPEAIAGSFKEAAKAYAPPLSIAMGALGAAGVVAPIIKGISDIKKTRFSRKGKGSAGSRSSGSVSAPSAGGASSVGIGIIDDLSANGAARLGADSNLGDSATATAANNVAGRNSSQVVFSESKYNSFKKQVAFKENKTTIS